MEAHPEEGWQTPDHNDLYGVCYKRPQTLKDRQMIAQRLNKELCPSESVYVDGIENALENAYEARPERYYVVSSKDFKISYRSAAVFQTPKNLREYLHKKYQLPLKTLSKTTKTLQFKDLIQKAKQ